MEKMIEDYRKLQDHLGGMGPGVSQFQVMNVPHSTSNTSSAAQGGGGSFKNKKPIGEVGCCESCWQSESTDGLKKGWCCVYWSGYNGCSGHLVGHITHNCWM
jgi:hypothetical protein